MILQSSILSEIEVDQKDIITFDQGIYGFQDIKDYVLIDGVNSDNPFKWLHAVGEDVCFVVMDPRNIVLDYDFEIKQDNIDHLGATSSSEFVLLSIVVLPQNTKDMTVNLKSPIIINTGNHKGMQIILDESKYEMKHSIIMH